ncbi:MAG: outer membrane beta-barrel protein [Clostridiales bacterium]|nr:outer membrane beta-barrel protein [Clostridiales bacterium]
MKNVKPILFFLVFLSIFAAQSRAEDNERILGTNFGYSVGLSNSDSNYYDNHKLGYRLGLNLQYYFSAHWAIQGEINYQKMTSYLRDAEDKSYVTSYLNIIYYRGKRRLSPYLCVGLGVENFSSLRLDTKIGGG